MKHGLLRESDSSNLENNALKSSDSLEFLHTYDAVKLIKQRKLSNEDLVNIGDTGTNDFNDYQGKISEKPLFKSERWINDRPAARLQELIEKRKEKASALDVKLNRTLNCKNVVLHSKRQGTAGLNSARKNKVVIRISPKRTSTKRYRDTSNSDSDGYMMFSNTEISTSNT